MWRTTVDKCFIFSRPGHVDPKQMRLNHMELEKWKEFDFFMELIVLKREDEFVLQNRSMKMRMK